MKLGYSLIGTKVRPLPVALPIHPRLLAYYTRALAHFIQSINLLRYLSRLNRSFKWSSISRSHVLPPLAHLSFTSIASLRFLQWTLTLLILLNSRSFPGAWHWRVLWCVFKVRTKYAGAWVGVTGRYYYRRFLATCTMNKWRSPQALESADTRSELHRSLQETRIMEMESWLASVTPIGEHPFEWEGRYDTWVGLDDSDFNMHMSNSSYPKILDFARTKASLELFPHFLRVGGHLALSSTHFNFIREIPLFTRYQLRLSIGAWDEKWCYMISHFVTKKHNRSAHSESVPSPRILLNDHCLPLALYHDLDGLTLHTIAVSRICFKVGRITVPPAVVFTTNGMSVEPRELISSSDLTLVADGDYLLEESLEGEKRQDKRPGTITNTEMKEFTRSNPPPSWLHHARQLIVKTHGGSEGKLREFYRGGWRKVGRVHESSLPSSVNIHNVPKHIRSESESSMDSSSSDSDSSSDAYPSTPPNCGDELKWWERAMGVDGPTDEKRKDRLEICRMLVGGMEGVRDILLS